MEAITTRRAAPRPGTARAALSHRDFRIIYIGLFASNIGTWMQNLALPAYVDERTNQATWVAMMVFAQLGPLFVLSIPAGVLADRFPRKPWLISNQAVQLVCAVGIAFLVAADASLWAIFFVQLVLGCANSLGLPALQSSIPMLVGRRDLPGALSLNGLMINGSRVIGPALAAALIGFGMTVSQLFAVNAATYLFAILALTMVALPSARSQSTTRGWAKLLDGIRLARRRNVLSRMVVAMTVFSLLSLPYIALMPSIARLSFGIAPESATYKWLYSIWGLGGCCGALACGSSMLMRFDRRRMITVGFRAFAVSMTLFTIVDSAALAMPISFFVGFSYLVAVTSIATIFQTNMHDHERAQLMSLWFLAFGGTIAVGGLIFGPVVDRWGPRPVLILAVVVALWLSWWSDLINRPAQLLEAGDEAVEPGHAARLDQQGVAGGE